MRIADTLVISRQQEGVVCIEGEPCESSLAHNLLCAQCLCLVVGQIEHLRVTISLTDK